MNALTLEKCSQAWSGCQYSRQMPGPQDRVNCWWNEVGNQNAIRTVSTGHPMDLMVVRWWELSFWVVYVPRWYLGHCIRFCASSHVSWELWPLFALYAIWQEGECRRAGLEVSVGVVTCPSRTGSGHSGVIVCHRHLLFIIIESFKRGTGVVDWIHTKAAIDFQILL